LLVVLENGGVVMFRTLREDIRAIFAKDPAAKNYVEVLLCYPGLHALIGHRFAHFLHRIGIPLIPRLVSHVMRFLTGIEIHPGAEIGRGVVIDHGMGVVIGETAEVGDDVLIYQGVTLGGVSLNKGKRHPTIGSGTTLGAGAKVLGPITIGENSLVGSGSVVVKPVPPGSTVVGIPGRVVSRDRLREKDPGNEEFPDPDSYVLSCILRRIEALEGNLPDKGLNVEDRQKTCVFQQEGVTDFGQCLTSR
jgi:serine O-acetyltransferase